ncbi:DUF169 domain-containing protein [candidate division KSB1 bacterium]|nr:DUF169 domain-containing protein [candidate division KSB1 bacterium]
MNTLQHLYEQLRNAFDVDDLHIPLTAVKFYRKQELIPGHIYAHHPTDLTLTSCQATKQASLGDAVCLTLENIGCVAAAISFGLVNKDDEQPLRGPRVYTDIMKNQSGLEQQFNPPTPRDFTEGIVYACRNSGHFDYCLFGKEDSGRYKDVRTAKLAVSDMMAIQPAIMKGVFFFNHEFDDQELEPDVIVLGVRPVELARLVQAYQYQTGRPVQSSMGAVRVVNSDLIVRPYLTQDINISTYCVGARLIAQFEGDRLGMGMPFSVFQELVKAMEASRTGYPYHQYPGAGG